MKKSLKTPTKPVPGRSRKPAPKRFGRASVWQRAGTTLRTPYGIAAALAAIIILAWTVIPRVTNLQATAGADNAALAGQVQNAPVSPVVAATPQQAGTSQQLAQPDAAQTIQVRIVEDSKADAVNAVQTKITYPADKLAYGSMTEGTAFQQVLATDTSKSGTILLARGVAMGTHGVSGVQAVATITFTVKPGATAPFPVTIDQSSSMLVRAADSTNILGSTGGATLSAAIAQ